MRFEQLRLRVARAEQRVETCMDRAQVHRRELGLAWRIGWTPARIVVAGLLSGFLIGRAEPLSKVGAARWLQMLGTASSLVASVRAAAASAQADAAASVAVEEAAVAQAAADESTGTPQRVAPAATTPHPVRPEPEPAPVRAPAPAEAATEVSEDRYR